MYWLEQIRYVHFDSIPSTNKWVKDHCAELDPKGITCITASEQTAGYGRFQREWISPKGKNICATLFFVVAPSDPFLANLAQIFAYSCAEMLQEVGFRAQLKWPNDILLGDKKMGGVLCETVSLGQKLGVALGIGVNINVEKEVLENIDQPATSLLVVSGREWEVSSLLQMLLRHFVSNLNRMIGEGFAPFADRYNDLLVHKGKEITCRDGTAMVSGICKGVSKEGKLLLELPSGKVVAVATGEITSSGR